MRKQALFGMPRDEALELLDRAPFVTLASTTEEGEPVLRVMNAAVDQRALVFHGAPVGEKTLVMGRPAVVSVIDVVAHIPSYFIDPERACPSTTLYRSVQVHGTLEPIENNERKASALSALMHKHQPEGRYEPIDPGHARYGALYQSSVNSLLVFAISLERLDGKAKLGQNRSPSERRRMLEHLWTRGAPGDPNAIDRVLAACPDTPTPSFMRMPEGLSLSLAPAVSDAEAVAEMLRPTYWNDRFTTSDLVDAHTNSSAWIVAKDAAGSVVASARAVSDERKHAWIYDVIVAEGMRRRGIGDALVRVLLDHPRVRRARLVHLGTRDAQPLYARMGFVDARVIAEKRAYASTHMVLERSREER